MAFPSAVVMLGSLVVGLPLKTTPGDLFERDRWMSSSLLGLLDVAPPGAWIEVRANNDSVSRNVRMGTPLRIGREAFRDGLFVHAVSELVVRLPAPGERFSATIGVDSNYQTLGGRGSVAFSVEAGERELFRSELMREGMPSAGVDVDLDGAMEVVLRVGDGGDGISCDQANWAQARIELEDGRTLRLGELPLVDARKPAWQTTLPFSFRYGGQDWSQLLGDWEASRDEEDLGNGRSALRLTFDDPDTALRVRCEAVSYEDFPVIEWTVFLENRGDGRTPLIEDLQALDMTWERWNWPDYEGLEFLVHHSTGSPCTPTDFEPHETYLGAGESLRLAGANGRPTSGQMCYWNLQCVGEGIICGLGWPGQWAASFERDGGTQLRLRAGQEATRFVLQPGETARTPLVALLFWSGDWLDGQNLWRRWMVAHNLPRPGGKLPPPQWNACSSLWFAEMTQADEASQIQFIDRYLEEGLKIDYWWMDAGWYPCDGWPNTGTWEPDLTRFPGGFVPITDHAHERGLRSLVWFEPERVTPGTWLYEQHPEWLLGADGGQKLLNLGNPDARGWLTDHIDRLLTEQGIDLYRQDFNMDPLGYWHAADGPEGQGLTEMRHVEGYLAYWDELRRRHPDMPIDTCSSGGRRDDLETLRRAVPLHRSDYLFEPVSQQCHTYGLALWVPFFGIGINSDDPYVVRSAFTPALNTGWDVRREDLDYDALRKLTAEWRRIAPCLLGDYYPLTPYSTSHAVWVGWQFDRPDLGEGIVQVFRREDSIYEAARLPLRGLDGGTTYRVTDMDRGELGEFTGAELMASGLPAVLGERPAAAMLLYERVD